MLLFNGEGISKAFGTKQLFKDLGISIFAKDRIGLIGQNGSGKSTLLKIIAGIEKGDEGILSARRGLKLGYLPQSCSCPDKRPIEVLLDTLRLEPLVPEYDRERLAIAWLEKLGFTGEEPSAARLSGGWKKRLILAKEMISSPDLLLLDEPTNHLDLDGVIWLEDFLIQEAPTYLLVSHDRHFLQHVTNRIIEIDPAYPKGFFTSHGSYTDFLARKRDFLDGQLQQEASIASKVRRETKWLQSNPKARTTKSQARIDQAHELLGEFAALKKRNLERRAAIDFTSSERDTKKLLVAKNIAKEMGGKILFQKLDFTLSPGTRIGLMGPNGSGKTTLLRILANEIAPDLGTIKRGDALQTVYFDQHRNQLEDHLSLRQTLAPNSDFVKFRGESIHLNGWCKRFLFSPNMLDLPIGKLSGGERARLAIAHLMLQPADLLLLDEPTNDLDIPTLETLETSLSDFPGAIVLITHDRCMLDRLCTSFLSLAYLGKTELFTDYSQWETSIRNLPKELPKEVKEPLKEINTEKVGLSQVERKEYQQIEGKILKWERELKEMTDLLDKFDSSQDSGKLTSICTQINLIQNQIDQLYLRWELLDQKRLNLQ